MNQAELDTAANCAERSHFLEWLNGSEETKTEEVPRVRGEVFTVQQPATSVQPAVCAGGFAERARTPAEAGAERAEAEAEDSAGLAEGGADRVQPIHTAEGRGQALHKLWPAP